MKRLAVLIALSLAVTMLSATVANAVHETSPGTIVVVHPDDMQGWAFFEENTPGGLGELVAGPDVPPLGDGSARLALADGSQGMVIGKFDYAGLRFADITTLTYNTYRTSGSPALAIALQFAFSEDVDDPSGWQGRLTFEPYHDGTYPVGGEWQEWDTLSMRGWWGSAAPLNTTCPQSAPCTLAEVVDVFPNSGINPGDSQVVFKAGSGWTGGFDGNVDAFSIGTADGTTTYDFEAEAPVVVPTDPETRTDCMKGGWEAYGFKNQGQCNQFVNTGFDSR